MNFDDAVSLIDAHTGTSASPRRWADLGAGSGLFTKALASLLPGGSHVYAIDRKPGVADQVSKNSVTISALKRDFLVDELELPLLDGILMANSIHYVRDKAGFIKRISSILSPGAGFLIVEYDITKSNQWVPYPISFSQLPHVFEPAGFRAIRLINKIPSIYHDSAIYGCSIEP